MNEKFFWIKNVEVTNMINLIKKYSKNHYENTLQNLFSASSSFLQTPRLKKVGITNVGNAGLGKSYCTKNLMFDCCIFDNLFFISDFSPESFQDLVCFENKENKVLLVPEIDEFMGFQDKMILILKNLYDGDIEKILKGKKKEGEKISYRFDSVVITSVNNLRESERYKPILDRYHILCWNQTSEELMNKIKQNKTLTKNEIFKIRNYFAILCEKISKLKKINIREERLIVKTFERYINIYNERSQRSFNHFKTLTKVCSLFLKEKQISVNTSEYMLHFFIENKYQLNILTKNYKVTYYEGIINSLKNNLFSKHNFVRKKQLIQFLFKESNYSKSYIATKLISRLIKENRLKIVIKSRKYYYKMMLEATSP